MTNWQETIKIGDILHDEDAPFTERRDAIVARIRASEWFKNDTEEDLAELMDELAETEGEDAFDWIFKDVYDLADAYRIWLDPFDERDHEAAATP